ncbi:hypothetical protein I862_03930 [endosymbiont of Acanthamoeba sp. UWC8]|uniref:hypothetical protein n=1 Tax=endosymbiont of Acanthamoeba sp. UWC8 TaxID=86106 RepID=UPI0004D0B9D7|nr:hypothetical protein [endosymbiont of Acanthamoeba sp. UWC8]AIF81346.1 hypothetical protein I862_03930 [endosymbiont of Acanthamoeba sp. UWC8]
MRRAALRTLSINAPTTVLSTSAQSLTSHTSMSGYMATSEVLNFLQLGTSKEHLTIGELEELADALKKIETYFYKGRESSEIAKISGFIIEAREYFEFLNYGPVPSSINEPSSVRKVDAIQAIIKIRDLLENKVEKEIGKALEICGVKANVKGVSETIESRAANKKESVAEEIISEAIELLNDRGKEVIDRALEICGGKDNIIGLDKVTKNYGANKEKSAVDRLSESRGKEAGLII